MTHFEGETKVEGVFQSIRPGSGVQKEIVSMGVEPLAYGSRTCRARTVLAVSLRFGRARSR